ncbi:MAG: hypothetical protein IT544_02080 [Rhodobacteraceae bacterium]|nr:hypothetical protein [Paracoccaceae bacterium]
MPLTHFLSLITLIIATTGLALDLTALWADLPLAALGVATFAGSLVLGAH